MAQLTVRNLDRDLVRRLERRAQRHGLGLEETVLLILRDAVKDEEPAASGLGSHIAVRFAGAGLREDLPELHGQRVRRR